jgi:hypothetical protein
LGQFIFNDKATGILNQILQKLEAFGPKLDFTSRPLQAPAYEIERVSLKSESLLGLAIHTQLLKIVLFNQISAKFQPIFRNISGFRRAPLLRFLCLEVLRATDDNSNNTA